MAVRLRVWVALSRGPIPNPNLNPSPNPNPNPNPNQELSTRLGAQLAAVSASEAAAFEQLEQRRVP